jgi:hypothetical protein
LDASEQGKRLRSTLRPQSACAYSAAPLAILHTGIDYREQLCPLSRWLVVSATCKIFQIRAVALSTFSKRLAAVVRKRTVTRGEHGWTMRKVIEALAQEGALRKKAEK